MLPCTFIDARSPPVAPVHCAIRYSPGCTEGRASATTPLPPYTVPSRLRGVPAGPRYRFATDESRPAAIPVVVERVTWVGYQMFPRPAGPIWHCAVPGAAATGADAACLSVAMHAP